MTDENPPAPPLQTTPEGTTPEWIALMELTWDERLRIVAADGDCAAVLEREPSFLLGRQLWEALGSTEREARRIDELAASPGACVTFTASARPSGYAWLRLSTGAMRDGLRRAGLLDLDALLEGAPPAQISRLSSSLSHELRNPLSSVKMAVQTVARNPALSDRDKRRMSIANREIRTLERMLWQLSEYGRPPPIQSEPVSLRTVLDEATSLIALELEERRATFEVQAPDDLPRVPIDASRLTPVLAQVLLNVAAGLPSESTISVQLERVDAGCRLTLLDPGVGLGGDDLSRLFEPFGSHLARGAGLSLATLRQVLRLHDGEVDAVRLDDGRVEVSMTLPGASSGASADGSTETR